MPYGYFTSAGYMGLVGTRWMLFATDSDYYDFLRYAPARNYYDDLEELDE